MFSFLILASHFMGLRAPGKAILLALSLSGTVMNAPGRTPPKLEWTAQSYGVDGADVAHSHFFHNHGRKYKSLALMEPGTGEGHFRSAITNSITRVNMGNDLQHVGYDIGTMHLVKTLPNVQTYKFSPTSGDLPVIYDGNTVLLLTCYLHADKDEATSSHTIGGIPVAGERIPPSNLVPVWWAVIPKDSGVESAEIEVKYTTTAVPQKKKFISGQSSQLHDAFIWNEFRLLNFKLKKENSIRVIAD
ncbi:hypothetical protein PGT21_001505 [Puccinia graminis f. sp. tritici]|uniref:Uncharacterized protein n=1 Tax=Puccinia graminis f. sp. tritici TaxID=56615 RepID=A0A5B0MWT9_PUCGR|nr:hypothetical protein PGT21_001500 [Puccinia graminis f. sp. tritici]KAA1080300.1 hypothetical protein PGT21_001505 [Puccinia graminis f. sp. tritici]KAA1090334.1 hypothetical protein PGTUg99_000877 [Puccinia graminis f. sp. tritici]